MRVPWLSGTVALWAALLWPAPARAQQPTRPIRWGAYAGYIGADDGPLAGVDLSVPLSSQLAATLSSYGGLHRHDHWLVGAALHWTFTPAGRAVAGYAVAGPAWVHANGKNWLGGIAGMGILLPSLLGPASRERLRPFVETRVAGGGGSWGELLIGVRGRL